MAHPADPLTDLPHDERIRSRKVSGGVATIIADATGLSDARTARRSRSDLRDAALTVAGRQRGARRDDRQRSRRAR